MKKKDDGYFLSKGEFGLLIGIAALLLITTLYLGTEKRPPEKTLADRVLERMEGSKDTGRKSFHFGKLNARLIDSVVNKERMGGFSHKKYFKGMKKGVKNSGLNSPWELDLVNSLGSLGSPCFNIDTIAPIVFGPEEKEIMAAKDTYRAKIVVAAWSTSTRPWVRFGRLGKNGELTEEADTLRLSAADEGIGRYAFVPEETGTFEWGGEIGIQQPSGDPAFIDIPSQKIRVVKHSTLQQEHP